MHFTIFRRGNLRPIATSMSLTKNTISICTLKEENVAEFNCLQEKSREILYL